jgi:hypothetical protein
MALPGFAKTYRRAKRSLTIQAFIRKALANGPVSATRMHDMLCQQFDIEMHSSIYHAKCVGVKFVGRNPRARVWELPQDISQFERLLQDAERDLAANEARRSRAEGP